MILANGWIVTMDDAGTEHERGWLRIEDGRIAELGAGEPPRPADDDLHGAVVTTCSGMIPITRIRRVPSASTARSSLCNGATRTD